MSIVRTFHWSLELLIWTRVPLWISWDLGPAEAALDVFNPRGFPLNTPVWVYLSSSWCHSGQACPIVINICPYPILVIGYSVFEATSVVRTRVFFFFCLCSHINLANWARDTLWVQNKYQSGSSCSPRNWDRKAFFELSDSSERAAFYTATSI